MRFKIVLLTILLFGFTFLAPTYLLAQKIANLSVGGAVIKQTRKIVTDNEVTWSYQVQLTVLNTGSTPVLLYNCFESTACSNKVVFLNEELSSDDDGTRVVDRPYFVQASASTARQWDWPQIVNQLNSAQPTRSILTISPQMPYQTVVSFEIKQKFKIVGKDKEIIWENVQRSDEDNKPGVPISKTAKFVIEYRFVPLELISLDCEYNYPRREPSSCLRPYKDPEFLRSLRARWKPYGMFPLDSSGSFSIITSPIGNLEDHDDRFLLRSILEKTPMKAN